MRHKEVALLLLRFLFQHEAFSPRVLWYSGCVLVTAFVEVSLAAKAEPVFMWPLFAYFALVVILVTATLVVSYLLGPRHTEPATGEPYEGGIVSEGSARVRFSVRYYLIAAFFVVFDLEAVFLFAWAVAARESGWAGYCEVLLFVSVLFAALIYLWKVGALDWARKPRSLKAGN